VADEPYGRIQKATRAQLRATGVSVQNNALAATAVALASLMDSEPGARDAAAVARELRATVTELTKGAAPAGARSSLDELRARREQRRDSTG
jgi:outer membrane lipopolysaccharide assembly protein LptE/RlpB